MEKSVFQILNEYDITEHLKKKDRIIYLPWSKAWMIVKSLFPSAKFTINKAADGCIYHTDGKTAWVEVSITINDQTETESLAVMDFRNKSIPIDTITSADAEKSIKRCLVKCAALHGLGLSLWTGEELSSAARKKKEDDFGEDALVLAFKRTRQPAEQMKEADTDVDDSPWEEDEDEQESDD